MLVFDFFPTLVGGMSSHILSACATLMSSFGKTKAIHFESRASGRFPPHNETFAGEGMRPNADGLLSLSFC